MSIGGRKFVQAERALTTSLENWGGMLMAVRSLRQWHTATAGIALLGWTSVAGAQLPYGSARSRPRAVDFSQFAGETLETNGPINLGFGVVWTASSDGWLGDMSFGLRSNGYWDAGRIGYAALDASNSAMTFTFDSPVSSAGAFVNYAPFSGQGLLPTIEALDEFGNIIDTLTQDIRIPNGVNEGGLLGFQHEEDDIFSFRFRARFGVLDDFMWSRRGLIPAPSSLGSLGVAFLICGRRRRSS